MKSKTNKILISMFLFSTIIFLSLFSLSVVYSAEVKVSGTATKTTPEKLVIGACSDDPAKYSKSTGFTPLVQCGNAGQHCCDFTEAMLLINRVLKWFISISGIIAAITLAYAGANILMHPDSPSELTKAWEMFRKTAIGILIILGAWLVVHTAISAIINPSINALRFLGN